MSTNNAQSGRYSPPRLSRASPAIHLPQPSNQINLPPLSTIDPRHQQHSHTRSPPGLSIPLPSPNLAHAPPQYGPGLPSLQQYFGPPIVAPGHYAEGLPPHRIVPPLPGGAPFAMTGEPDPNGLIAAGKHKKEIKRRTKTGCLTCRKRRIKVRAGPPLHPRSPGEGGHSMTSDRHYDGEPDQA